MGAARGAELEAWGHASDVPPLIERKLAHLRGQQRLAAAAQVPDDVLDTLAERLRLQRSRLPASCPAEALETLPELSAAEAERRAVCALIERNASLAAAHQAVLARRERRVDAHAADLPQLIAALAPHVLRNQPAAESSLTLPRRDETTARDAQLRLEQSRLLRARASGLLDAASAAAAPSAEGEQPHDGARADHAAAAAGWEEAEGSGGTPPRAGRAMDAPDHPLDEAGWANANELAAGVVTASQAVRALCEQLLGPALGPAAAGAHGSGADGGADVDAGTGGAMGAERPDGGDGGTSLAQPVGTAEPRRMPDPRA